MLWQWTADSQLHGDLSVAPTINDTCTRSNSDHVNATKFTFTQATSLELNTLTYQMLYFNDTVDTLICTLSCTCVIISTLSTLLITLYIISYSYVITPTIGMLCNIYYSQ